MAQRPGGRTTRKIFHKIGEVCEITKTEPYVLRYWESEFPFLAPEKNRAGQRIYTDEDIQTVLAIKRLLYEEGYTTAGARRKLEQERREGGAPSAEATPEAENVATGAAGAVPDPGPGPEPGPARPGTPADTGDEPEARVALRKLRQDLLDLRQLLDAGGST